MNYFYGLTFLLIFANSCGIFSSKPPHSRSLKNALGAHGRPNGDVSGTSLCDDEGKVKDAIKSNCLSCHNGSTASGKFDANRLIEAKNGLEDNQDFIGALDKITANKMPPSGVFAKETDKELFSACAEKRKTCNEKSQTPTMRERLLSAAYFRNAVSQVLGRDALTYIQNDLVPTTRKPGAKFDSITAPVGLSFVNTWRMATMKLSGYWTKQKLAALNPCVDAMNGPINEPSKICAERVLTSVMKGFYRRQPKAIEVTEALAIFTTISERKDSFEGLAFSITYVMQTPSAVYYLVPVEKPNQLTNEQILERLALVIKDGPPSELDWKAISASGIDLKMPETRKAIALQMMQTPDAVLNFSEFGQDWLDFRKSSTLGFQQSSLPPDLSPQLVAESTNEAKYLIESTYKLSLSVTDLMTTSRSRISGPNLSKIYGMPDSEGQDIQLPDRGGFPERPINYLTGVTAIEKRPMFHLAKRFLDTVVCEPLGTPPADAASVASSIKLPDKPMGIADTMEILTASGTCVSCHKIMNGVGRSLMEFDNFGQRLTSEPVMFHGQSTQVPLNTEVSTVFGGKSISAKSLRDLLKQGPVQRQMLSCFVQSFIESSMGQSRNASTMCRGDEIAKTLDLNSSIQENILTIISSSDFLVP